MRAPKQLTSLQSLDFLKISKHTCLNYSSTTHKPLVQVHHKSSNIKSIKSTLQLVETCLDEDREDVPLKKVFSASKKEATLMKKPAEDYDKWPK